MAETMTIPASGNPMRKVLGIRDFLLLWVGQGSSLLGDSFYGIAGAWLILKMTGDPMALGMVMALGGIPRAIFTIIGGAITDRISPRKLMIITDLVRLGILILCSVQLFTRTVEVWMIYVYAMTIGSMAGLFGPASMSMIPHIVPEESLQAGNSLSQGTSSLIGFVGPALAGGMIALFHDEYIGMAIAMSIDAFTFLISVITLWLMKSGNDVQPEMKKAKTNQLLESVKEGFVYIFKDPVLRMMFIMIAAANLCFAGPLQVGIPYLADTRFTGGSATFGIILSGYSGGYLLGIISSGVLPRLAKRFVRRLMVILFTTFGLGIIAMTWITAVWLATLDLIILGILVGYLSITLITGLQRCTPKDLMGRLMSMILLANLSMMPLSQALAGFALKVSVELVFIASGLIMVTLTAILAFSKTAGSIGERLGI